MTDSTLISQPFYYLWPRCLRVTRCAFIWRADKVISNCTGAAALGSGHQNASLAIDPFPNSLLVVNFDPETSAGFPLVRHSLTLALLWSAGYHGHKL